MFVVYLKSTVSELHIAIQISKEEIYSALQYKNLQRKMNFVETNNITFVPTFEFKNAT